MRTGGIGSAQTNSWSSQRREERKTTFAKTGELAIFSGGGDDSAGYSRGSNISNANSMSTVSSLRAKDPFGGSNMPRNMQGAGNKVANNYGGDRPPSNEDVRDAQSSLQLLKMKMNSGARANDLGMDTRNNYQQSNTNSQYNRVFKPNTLSKERLKAKDIDDMTKNLNDELDVIQSNLNKKNHLLKNSNSGDENYQSRPPISNKPNIGGTNNKFGGIPRSENKSNAFSNDHQDFGSENFPSRISGKTLRETSPANGGAPKNGLFKSAQSTNAQKGYNSQGITLPSYQDSGYNDSQPLSTTNKGNPIGNGGLKYNMGDDGYNKVRPAGNKFEDDGPTDTRTSKVFSKPNLKRAPPTKPKEEAEDYNPPKNIKPTATKNVPAKKGAVSNYQSETTYNPQPNPLEEIPIAKLKGEGNQIPDEDMDADLITCPEGCGRKFKQEALEKHGKVCKKVFQSQRKKYDSSAARKTEDQLLLEVKPKKNQPQSKQPPKKANASADPKWKNQSEALRAGLKAARGETLSSEEQTALKQQAEDDLILCPNCNRKFNEKAAEKHLPFCASKSKVVKNNAPGKKK